jgi:hypothetical protein
VPQGRVRIIPEEVVHETVDGEVILIALQTGAYYSLEGAGADVWEGLVEGRHTDEIVADLESRYGADAGVVRSAVLDLVQRLAEERLVAPDPEAAPRSNGRPHAIADGSAPPFPQPVLHKFTDMQDFLLVDPIHDVTEAGWPHSPVAP